MQIISPKKQKKTKKAKKKKKKSDKSEKLKKKGKAGKSDKSTNSAKSEVREEPQEVISKRVTLASFTCPLSSFNWSDETIDFYWANHPRCAKEAILIEGSLKVSHLPDYIKLQLYNCRY